MKDDDVSMKNDEFQKGLKARPMLAYGKRSEP